MDKHTDELRRLEEALLEEQPPKASPAFPSEDEMPQEDPVEYRNFANHYGQKPSQGRDRVLLGLVITACVLCAGLLAVLIYWLRYLL